MMIKRRSLVRLHFLVFAVCFSPSVTPAQDRTNRLRGRDKLVTGTLFDQDKRPVNGAFVKFFFRTGLRPVRWIHVEKSPGEGTDEIYDQEVTTEYDATTNKDGHYRLDIPVGSYSVAVVINGQYRYIKTDKDQSIERIGESEFCTIGCGIGFKVLPRRRMNLEIKLR